MLDNHASGNPANIPRMHSLPARGSKMRAAFAPVLDSWSNELTSVERASAYDEAKRESLRAAIDTWAEASGPDWFN